MDPNTVTSNRNMRTFLDIVIGTLSFPFIPNVPKLDVRVGAGAGAGGNHPLAKL